MFDKIRYPKIKLGPLIILREKPEVISPGPCWVIIESCCYYYCHDTFFGVLWQCITEWRNDKHLVGY